MDEHNMGSTKEQNTSELRNSKLFGQRVDTFGRDKPLMTPIKYTGPPLQYTSLLSVSLLSLTSHPTCYKYIKP